MMKQLRHLVVLLIVLSCTRLQAWKQTLGVSEQFLLTDANSYVHNTNNGPPDSEINALYDFYNCTDGNYWVWEDVETSGPIWDFTTAVVNPCQPQPWQGVYCSADNTTLLEIHLERYNLTGYIPPSFSNLTHLQVLDLQFNAVQQPLPTVLCALEELTFIELGANRFSGSIPACILHDLVNLTLLVLDENRLTGVLPDISIPVVAHKLDCFTASYNSLHGSIPATYTNFQNMETFNVEYNLFTGDISFCWTWPRLEFLGLGNNVFEGSFDDLPTANMANLMVLQVQSNQFTGSLPMMFQAAHNMILFSVFQNLFTGILPSYLSSFYRLVFFTVNDNIFTGDLDNVLSAFPFMFEFMVFSNQLTGTLPAVISTWPLLEGLFVQDNHFHGDLAPVFGGTAQPYLTIVDVSSNHFTGTIPKQLFTPSLFILNAFNLCLAPTLPSFICQAHNISVLSLDGITSYCAEDIWRDIPGSPQLSRTVEGGVPSCIWTNLPNLAGLYLSGNGLTGTIPALASYPLVGLDLSFNSFSGSIPKALQTSNRLIQLDLKSNKFIGEITHLQNFYDNPRNLSLEFSLDLSVNRLSGPIPAQFADATDIELVSGNLFQCSDSSPPPEHDPDGDGYVCGSDLLDISLWGFMCSCLLLALVAVLLLFAMKDIIYGQRVKWCSFANVQKLSKRVCVRLRSCGGQKKPSQQHSGAAAAHTTDGNGAVAMVTLVGEDVGAIPSLHPAMDEDSPVDRSSAAERNSKLSLVEDEEEEEDDEEVDMAQSYDPRRRGMRRSFFDGTRVSMTDRVSEILHNMPVVSSLQETLTFINDADRLEQSVQVWMELTPSNENGKLVFRDTYHKFVLYLLVVLWWRSKAKTIQVEHAPQYAKAVQELPHLILFLKSMRLIRRLSLALMVVGVVFTVPTYVTLKRYFSTYTKQYRWDISAAFLSGYQPAIAIFFMWAVMLAIIVFMIDRYIPMEVDSDLSYNVANNKSTAATSTPTLQPSIPAADQGPHRIETASADSTHTATTASSSSSKLRSSVFSTALFTTVADNSKFSLQYAYHRLIGPSMWFSIFALLCNLLVVLMIKALFVYLLVTTSKSIIVKIVLEMTLSLVDLCWDNLIVPLIITSLPKKKSTSRMLLKTAMLFFNGIVAPCISLAVVDKSCFNGLFQVAEAEYKSYPLFYCTSFLSSEECHRIQQLTKVEKYVPLFHYNYNCYSTILNEYLPIFFISFIFLTFFNPLLALFLANTSKKVDWQQLNIFPSIYFTSNQASTSDSRWLVAIWKHKSVDHSAESASMRAAQFSTSSSTADATGTKPWFKPKKVFYPDFLLSTLTHQMLVMLTFGMMYPPLAVAIAIVICIKSFTWEVLIGRWMVRDGFEAGTEFAMGNPLLRGNGNSTAMLEDDVFRDSASSLQSTSTTSTVVPLKIGRFSKQLEAVCKDAGCGPRRCLGLIAYGSGVFYAFVLVDMVGDQMGWTKSLWVPILVMAYATALIMLLKSNVTEKQHKPAPDPQASTQKGVIGGGAVLTEAAIDQLRQSSVNRAESKEQQAPQPPPRPIFLKMQQHTTSNPLHAATRRVKDDGDKDGDQADALQGRGIELRPVSSRVTLSPAL